MKQFLSNKLNRIILLVYVSALTQTLFETCPVIQRKNVRNYDTKTKVLLDKLLYVGLDIQAGGLYNLGDSRVI